MLRSEFQQIADSVFAELLPKVKTVDRQEVIDELVDELRANGMDIEDDEEEEEEGDEEA